MDVLSEIRIKVLKGQRIDKILSKAKKELTINDMLSFANGSMGRYFKELWGDPIPQDYNFDSFPFATFYTENITAEWKNLIAGCIYYKNEIKDFVLFKSQFEHLILDKQFVQAKEILDKIESQFGESFWLINSKFLIAELENGTEGNWALLGEVSEGKQNFLVRLIIESLSKKNETKVSYNDYIKSTFDQINSLPISNEIKSFLSFSLSVPFTMHFSDLPLTIYFYSCLSIVDRYLAIIKLSKEAYTIFDRDEYKSILYQLKNFYKHFGECYQIKNILTLENQLPLEACTIDLLNIQFLEHYYLGKKKEAFDLLSEELQSNFSPTYLVDLNLFFEEDAEDISRLFEENTIKRKINSLICKLILKGDSFRESLDEAKKLLLQLSDFELFDYFDYFITKEFYIVDIEKHSDTICFIGQSKISIDAVLNVVSKNIFDLKRFYLDKIIDYTSVFSLYKPIFNSDYQSAKEHLNVSSDIKYMVARLAQENELYEDSEALFKAVIEHGLSFYRALSYIGLIDNYLYVEDIRSLTILIGQIIQGNINYLKRIDLLKISNLIDEKDFEGVDDLLFTPLIFSNAGNEAHDVYIALETVISNFGLEKPSEIISDSRFADQKLVDTILLKVCKVDVIKYFTAFENIQEVESERLTMLRYLSGKYPKSEAILTEIVELSQKDVIRRGYKSYNYGKISLNSFQLRKYLLNRVSTSYSRFKHQNDFSQETDYKSVDYDIGDDQYRIIVDLKNLGTINTLVSLKDPSFISFKFMMNDIRDVFLFSKEYGLDGYLSTRIRHGVLINHVKKIFMPLQLLSLKNSDEYEDIQYWNTFFDEDDSENVRQCLQTALKSFSGKIDQYCSQLRLKNIQIRTERTTDKEEALFDFTFKKENYLQLYAVARENNIQALEFVELMINVLISQTDMQLETVRKFFRSEVDKTLRSFIDELRNDLQSVLSKFSLPELSANINQASTNISNELSVISNWFYLREEDSKFRLTQKEVVQVSVKVSNTLNPHFQIHPNIEEINPIEVVYSLGLIDILKMLLENVILHSGCDPNELDLTILAKFDKTNNVMSISTTHNLENSVDSNYVKDVLQEYKLNWYNNQFYGDRVSAEGKSGLKKIKRILEYDLEVKNFFDFDFKNDMLTITITFEVIILHE